MASLSLKYRIAGIIFLLEAVMMAAVLGTTLSQNLEANRRQSTINEQVLLTLLADLSRTALFTTEYDELQPYIEKVIDDPHVKKILLMDSKNRIVVSSDFSDVGNLRPNLDNTPETFWRQRKIANSSGVLGEIAINFSHAQLLAANRNALDLGISVALIGMTLIAVIGVFIGYLLTRRLDQLKRAALQLADGNMKVKVELPGNDEVAIVGQAFEQMARGVEKHVEELRFRELELRKAHDSLEERIKERTHELAIARDQALESSRTKSSFLANMSHELRTPLNAIIGYSEILAEEAQELGYQDFVHDLKKIQSSGTHLLHLISEILDLSKIESGKVEFFIEDISIQALVGDVNATIEPLVSKNGNRYVVEIEQDIGKIRADAIKVRQALLNLLSNACKFTENGEIKLTIRKSCDDGFNWIYFDVKDTGIGISEEQQKKLFKEFSQADASTTRKYGGTGLGLTISRRYCRMMGGDITISSEANKGATFSIKLPAEVDIPNMDSLPDDPELIRFKDLAGLEKSKRERRSRVSTILIIDDDHHVRDLLSTALKKLGFNTLPVESGQEGLFVARQQQPDAIILDVLMPDLDGWTVLKTLKADPSTASIPVVMLTVCDEEGLGYALGAKFFLRKPLNFFRLEQAIKSCVRQSQWQADKMFLNSRN